MMACFVGGINTSLKKLSIITLELVMQESMNKIQIKDENNVKVYDLYMAVYILTSVGIYRFIELIQVV